MATIMENGNKKMVRAGRGDIKRKKDRFSNLPFL